jgi:hypothetical protein
MDMPVPKEMIVLNFLMAIAKNILAIRANIEGAELVIQAVCYQRRIFEQPVVPLLAVFRLCGSIEIGKAAEVGRGGWKGFHQVYPEIKSDN